MLDKIAFLCTNPWEQFLPVIAQSRSKQYFQWICKQVRLKDRPIDCREMLEIYGENHRMQESDFFEKTVSQTQILYVQSRQNGLIEKVFGWSDLVVMGVPGCKKEFEKMVAVVFPWRHRIMFLWDHQYCRGEHYVMNLCKEYRLREEQMIKINMKKAPVR